MNPDTAVQRLDLLILVGVWVLVVSTCIDRWRKQGGRHVDRVSPKSKLWRDNE